MKKIIYIPNLRKHYQCYNNRTHGIDPQACYSEVYQVSKKLSMERYADR